MNAPPLPLSTDYGSAKVGDNEGSETMESITLGTSLFLIFLAVCGGISIVRELTRFFDC